MTKDLDWINGDNGTLLRTTDSSDTWTKAKSIGLKGNFNGLFFDKKTGWALAYKNHQNSRWRNYLKKPLTLARGPIPSIEFIKQLCRFEKTESL